MPISPNSPCRGAPDAVRRVPGEDGGALCLYPRYRETLPGGRSYDILDQIPDSEGDDFGPITVPADRMFVMGDNRDDSMDSRFDPSREGVGLLPVENVLGEALVGFWSTDGSVEWVRARSNRPGQAGRWPIVRSSQSARASINRFRRCGSSAAARNAAPPAPAGP